MTLYDEARQMILKLYSEVADFNPPRGTRSEVETLLKRLELADKGPAKLLVVVDIRQYPEDESVEVTLFTAGEPQEWECVFVEADGRIDLSDYGIPSTTIVTGSLERVAANLPHSLKGL